MSRWRQVMVITQEKSTEKAYELLCNHDEYHAKRPAIQYVTEEFTKVWNEGPVPAFHLGGDNYYSVALAKSRYAYPPFDYDTLIKAFPVVEISGEKAYDRASSDLGLSGRYLCLSELYEDEHNNVHVGFEDRGKVAFIEMPTHPARFGWCNYAACDAYAIDEKQRTSAQEAPCIPLDEIAMNTVNAKTPEEIKQIFEDFKKRKATFNDWRHFGNVLASAKQDCSSEGFVFGVCIPNAAVVTPDGNWHDASTDYNDNDNEWTANYYDDIVKKYAGQDFYVTRFLAEDW